MNCLIVEPKSHHKAPNLGLLYLTAALSDSNHQGYLLDLNYLEPENPAAAAISLIGSLDIDLVGVSVCDVNYQWSMDLAAELARATGVKIIAGGPQVNSLGPDILTDNPYLDLALAGEAETSFIELLDHLQAGAAPAAPGLIHRCEDEAAIMPARPGVQPLTRYRPNYGHLGIESMSGYMLLTSRGCPYKCRFCCRNTGDAWRPRDLDSCFAELEEAKRDFGIVSFRIVDASFNINEDRVVEFCRRLKQSGLDLAWMVSGIRADRLGEASVAALKDAGCAMLSLGVESIDPQVFQRIDKGETIEQIKRAISLCQRHGLETGLYMIHGLPGDRFQRSIRYARELQALRPDYVMYNHAVPYTGTDLFRWVSKHGHLQEGYSWLQTRDFERVAFWTDDFDQRQRLDSFRVIQTIVHVINFASDDPADLEALRQEIMAYDPDYYDEHMAYLESTRNKRSSGKNDIKRLHSDADIHRRAGYTGCVDLKSGLVVETPNS